MSVFIVTAIILIVFFPLIYFMWATFISMWVFRNKMRDEEEAEGST